MGRIASLIAIILVSLCSMAFSTVINVPSQYATIQAGINASVNGDTVLVQPGTYLGNIDYLGMNIVIASRYLTTGDSSYIQSTVILGDSLDYTISFKNNEDTTASIIGFTIKCEGEMAGYGGIYCLKSNPVIKDNFINRVRAYHGGVFCDTANPIIENNIILQCRSSNFGGGIFCRASSPKITGNVISGCCASL
jgi:hypothetical protein